MNGRGGRKDGFPVPASSLPPLPWLSSLVTFSPLLSVWPSVPSFTGKVLAKCSGCWGHGGGTESAFSGGDSEQTACAGWGSEVQ